MPSAPMTLQHYLAASLFVVYSGAFAISWAVGWIRSLFRSS